MAEANTAHYYGYCHGELFLSIGTTVYSPNVSFRVFTKLKIFQWFNYNNSGVELCEMTNFVIVVPADMKQ